MGWPHEHCDGSREDSGRDLHSSSGDTSRCDLPSTSGDSGRDLLSTSGDSGRDLTSNPPAAGNTSRTEETDLPGALKSALARTEEKDKGKMRKKTLLCHLCGCNINNSRISQHYRRRHKISDLESLNSMKQATQNFSRIFSGRKATMSKKLSCSICGRRVRHLLPHIKRNHHVTDRNERKAMKDAAFAKELINTPVNERDLPSTSGFSWRDLPPPSSDTRCDLPSPNGCNRCDLLSTSGGSSCDLPSTSGVSWRDLPQPSSDARRDLPSPSGGRRCDMPSSSGDIICYLISPSEDTRCDLPSTIRGSGRDLPSTSGESGCNLATTSGDTRRDLPSPSRDSERYLSLPSEDTRCDVPSTSGNISCDLVSNPPAPGDKYWTDTQEKGTRDDDRLRMKPKKHYAAFNNLRDLRVHLTSEHGMAVAAQAAIDQFPSMAAFEAWVAAYSHYHGVQYVNKASDFDVHPSGKTALHYQCFQVGSHSLFCMEETCLPKKQLLGQTVQCPSEIVATVHDDASVTAVIHSFHYGHHTSETAPTTLVYEAEEEQDSAPAERRADSATNRDDAEQDDRTALEGNVQDIFQTLKFPDGPEYDVVGDFNIVAAPTVARSEAEDSRDECDAETASDSGSTTEMETTESPEAQVEQMLPHSESDSTAVKEGHLTACYTAQLAQTIVNELSVLTERVRSAQLSSQSRDLLLRLHSQVQELQQPLEHIHSETSSETREMTIATQVAEISQVNFHTLYCIMNDHTYGQLPTTFVMYGHSSVQ